jgi:acyl-CoA synthetase (AMP-forming)/AMP-acid ligase II
LFTKIYQVCELRYIRKFGKFFLAQSQDFIQNNNPLKTAAMFYLTQSLHRNAQAFPKNLATIYLNRQHTWIQTQDRVARLAGALQALGIQPNDRVAILALNSDRYLEYYFATWWAGAAVVPMNVRWSVPENVYSLNDSGAKILFLDDAFAKIAPAIKAECTTLEHIVFTGETALPDDLLDYESLITNHAPIADVYRNDNDLAGIFYTGGTTGFPKGAMLTHASMLSSAYAVAIEMKASAGDRYLHTAPMFHLADGAASNSFSIVGATHVMVPMFTPDGVLNVVQNHGITHSVWVPTMIKMIVDSGKVPDFDVSSLKMVLYGASPIAESTLIDAMKAFPKTSFLQGYGQTELSPIVTILPPEYHVLEGPKAGKLRSAGRATFCAEISIRDENNQSVPNGTVGEIAVKGPNMMLGYWNKPDETAKALRGDGWLYTGDGAYMDDEGFVFIVDRMKDMIVTGGENVYSIEVENALMLHQAVSQAVVIGIPSPEWGEAVHAFVILKPGAMAHADELINHCKTLIANYKCPRSIEFRTEPFPLSGAGKILKKDLRNPYWEGKERMVN